MKFTVSSIRAAQRDFNEMADYLSSHSRRGAEAWTAAFAKALAHLEENADACPLAEEDGDFVDFELRETFFKTRRGHRYRILFTIRKTAAIILHIRGPGQDLVDPMEMREPE